MKKRGLLLLITLLSVWSCDWSDTGDWKDGKVYTPFHQVKSANEELVVSLFEPFFALPANVPTPITPAYLKCGSIILKHIYIVNYLLM